MAYKREGDTVFLTMTVDQYELLLLALGYATGAASKDGSSFFWTFVRLVNELNEGNPNFTPYELPPDPSPPASTPAAPPDPADPSGR